MEIALEVRDVFLRIEESVIFQGLNLALGRGESLLILGKSGSGKSLLLKICAGLITPEEGSVIVGGIDLATAPKEELQRLRARLGFVFQNSALISNMAIYDNVALPARYHTGWTEAEVRARVEEKMAWFGVDRVFDRAIPAQLSWEMHKRVALARAFILDPDVLLLDEPTSGLEEEKAEDLAGMIRDYQKRAGASLLMVGSEWPLLAHPTDRLGFLESGRIAAAGSVEEMRGHIKKKTLNSK